MTGIAYWFPVIGGGGLLAAALIYFFIKRMEVTNPKMVEIAEAIHSGAMVFLRREYTILAGFVLIVFLILSFVISPLTGLAFLVGACSSMLAGFLGMKAATRANVRTTHAANESGIGAALSVAFAGGSVMGLSVASLGLIGVGIAFLLYLNGVLEPSHITGFAMGASSIALFARVGGGIFTKSADVGAVLVGKVEAGIPEDDPRNPATIADNVGDCVGDTAGMGADIFESYVGSIIATIAIAAAGASKVLNITPENKELYMGLPILLVSIGLIASLIGVASIRVLRSLSPATALRTSTILSAVLMIAGALLAINGLGLELGIFWAIFIGTLAGI
ncbi:MAG TPA: sodium/proton-translocating pyrophosphatase, partial [Acidobacteriota bacterium]|nr:sodium/proton-translocating pyrophosphatase [Acidobacteriota bacterium]